MPSPEERLLGLFPGSGPADSPGPSLATASPEERLTGMFEPSAEEDLTRSHKAGLAVNRSPEEHAAYLTEKGRYSPEAVKKLTDEYRVEHAQQNLGRFHGGAETVAGSVALQAKKEMIAFRDWFVNEQKTEQDAGKRFAEGKATEEDIQTIARARRWQEDEQKLREMGIGGEVLAGIRVAPKLFGEFMAGKKIAGAVGLGPAATSLGSHLGRMGVITAASPGMYMDLARQKNLENGREADDWRGLPAAGLHAYSQLLVLGRVFQGAQGAAPGIRAGVLGSLKSGAQGAVESAIATSATNFADLFIPKAYKISTGYGTFENLMEGNVSEAGRKFAVDSLTFAAFAGMHRLADALGRDAPPQAPAPPGTGLVHQPQQRLRLDPTWRMREDEADPVELSAQEASNVLGVMGGDLAALQAKGMGQAAAIAKVREYYGLMKEHVRSDPDGAEKLKRYFQYRLDGMSQQEAYNKAFLEGGETPQLNGARSSLPAAPPSLPPAPETPTLPDAPPEPPGSPPAGDDAIAPGQSPEGSISPPARGPVRLGSAVELKAGDQMNPAERHALSKYGEIARIEVVNEKNEPVGDATIAVEGKTVHVPWLGGRGMGGGEGRGAHPFGAREVMSLARQIAEAFPDAEVMAYTPAGGRIRAGENRFIDLKKLRERGTRGAPADTPPTPAAQPAPRDLAARLEAGARVDTEVLDQLKQAGKIDHNEAFRQLATAHKEYLKTPGSKIAKGHLLARVARAERIAAQAVEQLGKDPRAGIYRIEFPEVAAELKRLATGEPPPAPKGMTPKEARDQWASMDTAARFLMPKEARAELFAAMRRGRIDPAEVKYAGESREQTADVTPLDPAIERQIDESGLPAAKKRGVKALMMGASTRSAEKASKGFSHETLRKEAIKMFGETPVKAVEEAARERLRAAKEAQESRQNAETFTGQGRTAGGGQRKSKSFLENFLREEGGYLNLQAIINFIQGTKTFFRAGAWKAWFASGGKANIPGVTFDNQHVLPWLHQRWNDYKRIVSDPQGMGRVPILRWLFEPGRTDTSRESEVFTANQAMKETGKDVGALWALHEREADKLFATEADGSYTRGNGSKGRMADDIEAEMRRGGSTQMSQAQRDWVHKVWTPLLRDAQAMLRDAGVAEWVDANGVPLNVKAQAYFPRQAIGKKGVDVSAKGGMGARPGSKAHFQKDRLYDSETEGAQEIIYDPSAKSRVAKFIAQVYRTIADHKMAIDPALQGETVQTRYGNLVAQNAGRLQQLSAQGKADLLKELKERAAHPVWGIEQTVSSGPAFAGRIFPKEIAERIEKMFAQESASWIKNVEKVSAAAKAVTLGGDASFMFIQLMPTLFRKPKVWATSVKESVMSIFDRERMSKYLDLPENAQAARDLVQVGSSIGRLHDFMAGLRKGDFATRLPGIGKAYEAAGRAFGTALDVAKIELWKAWSKTAKPNELRALAEAIDSMLMTGRMESVGLSPQRMMAERLMFLAPSYYRGGLNLMASAFQKGTPGTIARQALGATIAGSLITTVAAMHAVGLSEDEIEERLNPARGKFLKVPVELGDGKKIEIGNSNILTSYARLLGGAADHFASDRPIDTGADGNPMLRWLRGKAAFAPRLTADIITGKDYFGERIQPQEALMKAFEPLAVQQLLHGEGGALDQGLPDRTNVADALTSLMGFSSYSGSKGEQARAIYDDEARRQFGRGYSDLSFQEQARVVKAAKDRPEMPAKERGAREMEGAYAMQHERKQKLTDRLSDESRSKLDKLGRDVPGYLGTISVNGVDVPLDSGRLGRYEELLGEEYEKAIGMWDVDSLKKMNAEMRENRTTNLLTKAKERAKSRLIRESTKQGD